MEDRTAATIGFTVAGLALAVSLGWSDRLGTAASIAAGMGAAAFVLRRHGYLDRRIGAPVAGLAGVGLVLAGAGAVASGSIDWASSRTTIPGAIAAAGGLVLAMAGADARGMSRDRLYRQVRAVAVVAATGTAGLLVAVVWSGLLGPLAPRGPDGEITPLVGIVVSTMALGLGTGTVAIGFVGWTNRGIAFFDAAVPTAREIGYVLGGVLGIVALNLAASAAFQRVGVEPATHSIIRTAQADPRILLALVPLSFLFVGPGEELLFRNVVQKTLYDAFTPRAAIVIASGIFAAVHITAYSGPDAAPAEVIATLSIIFVLSVLLGWVYDRTRNVVVTALVHGSFNAISFAITYARIAGLV